MEYYQHNGMAEYHRVRSSSNMSDDDENDVVPTGNTDGAVPCCGCLTTTWIVMMVQQMINTATRRNAQQCRPTSTHPTGGSDAFHTPRRTMSLDDDDDALSPNRRSRSTWGDSSSEVDVSSSRRSRWVVQNGILVHVGKDGVSHAPTNSQTRRVFTHRAPPLFGNAKEREEQAKLRDGQDHAFEVLEQKRKPMQSLLELQQFIQDCQEYLPISLKVSAVNGSGFALEIQGPLVATSHPEVLGVVEDVLLEDCEGEHLRLVQIRYADVNFSTPREPSPAQDYASGWLVGDLGDSDDDSPVQRGKSLHECHARLIAFLRNLFDPVNRVAISSMRLSRCMFSPLELRIFLGAHQLTTLEVLVFDRCPLNNAHVESLVQIMREVSLVPGPNELHGSLIPSRGSSPPACSLRLRELQLSGVLTEEGVADLLQCLLSEESACTSLKALRVPNMALNSARQHPLVLNCPALQISANCYESTL